MPSKISTGPQRVIYAGTLITAPDGDEVSLDLRPTENVPILPTIIITIRGSQLWSRPRWELVDGQDGASIHLNIFAKPSDEEFSVPDEDIKIGATLAGPVHLRYRVQFIGRRWVIDLNVLGNLQW